MLSKPHPGSSAGGSRRAKGSRNVSERTSKKSENTSAGEAGFPRAAGVCSGTKPSSVALGT